MPDSVTDLLTVTEDGLYCPRGGFHIDPWRPVARAVFTHAHADHARPGHAQAFASTPSLAILRHRLGPDAALEGLNYGEPRSWGDARVSLHPAGHILGSAQVRVEVEGEVWVVTGDFKRAPDPTCAPFEVQRADVLITEATFGLPVYRWEEAGAVAESVFRWWEAMRAEGRPTVLFCYALGKAQRLLAELMRFTDRAVYVHGAVEELTALYRESGVAMLPTRRVVEPSKGPRAGASAPGDPLPDADASGPGHGPALTGEPPPAASPVKGKRKARKPAVQDFAGELVLAPVSARGTPWLRRFKAPATGFASGWMRLRGVRRRKGYERGFVLSDHADWPALLRTVEESSARRVLVTHGQSHALARYLREVKGLDAQVLETPFALEGEGEAE